MIVVTGGAGFVGSNLVRRLVESGGRVRVVDDLSTGLSSYLDDLDVEIVVGDIGDAETVERALDGASRIVHLAASTAVLESIADPLPGLRVNVVALVGLLKAAAARGIERFVFASSNAAIGESAPPIDERRVPKPSSPYGASKLAGEAYCSAFFQSFGLPVVMLRFANVYGPNALHKGSAVHKFIRATISGKPISVYGDGLQTRDFVNVSDVCVGIELALRLPAAVGELFQIGTGIETSVLGLISLLEDISGRPIEVHHLPANSGEIRRNSCDITKASTLLGYRPQVPLPDGLRTTFRWFSEQLDRNGARVIVTQGGD